MSPTDRVRLSETLASDLQFIAGANVQQLRDLWSARLGEAPPLMRSPEIMRRMLAYRLQVIVHGQLSLGARRSLERMEAARAAPAIKAPPTPVRLSPGTTLVRDWKGRRHEVRVLVDGFEHQGQTYRSLSEVARAIAGTRWNGPLFFGLRDKMKDVA